MLNRIMDEQQILYPSNGKDGVQTREVLFEKYNLYTVALAQFRFQTEIFKKMNETQIVMLENQAKANWIVMSPRASKMFQQQMEAENDRQQNDRRDQNSID